jgi:prevent-host-death family protein
VELVLPASLTEVLQAKLALDLMATCGYIGPMKIVSIREAKNKLTELARKVEGGETIVVTRNGRPVFDLVPHRKTGSLDFEAGRAYLRSIGCENPFPYVADDFDAPLPEEFLITPEGEGEG